ncbi:unnamed protein product [Medioppia subpectinata]|uniref:Nose resistant-to-fluoxetine protein N-terminal domain-containing protein n=1 Tax=Medioppia subpectinata TaxID=1979941 RepID=A0A7R9Q3D9_9ACAR|nr:unnamed protein product [Medioppia subpectinata]CAG2111202.1 unnamed protein product [Medioppia subpectinata]
MTVMDTMGRFLETGTADGKHSSFGEYDECLDLESPEDKGLVVKGQYCLVKVILPYPSVNSYKRGDPYDPTFDEEGITPFKYLNGGNFTTITKMIENLNTYKGSSYRLGFCTPHLCKKHEIEEFINKVLYPITRLPLEVGRYCIRKDKSEDLTMLQILSVTILVTLTIIVITSTGIEIYNIIYEKSITEDNRNLGETKFAEEEPFKVNPYYYTFSLVTNSRKLFEQSNRFTSLDTIKMFVILHIYVFHLYNTLATIGIVTLKRPFATYPSQVLELDRYTTLRNTLTFDVLFIMSRYMRFAVPMLGSMIFINVLPLMGSGPIWDEGTQWVTTGCQNPLVVLFGMLFISNYNDQFALMERQSAVPFCNPVTWFVSAIFQLHIIIPILIIICYKNAKYGVYTTVGVIVLAMIASIIPTVIFNILPQMQYILIDSYEELYRSFTWYHLSTTQYIVSFVVGVAGGYLIRRDWTLSIEYEVMGWCASVFTIIIVFMWSNTFWKVQKSAPLYSVLLWFTFGKFGFAVAITWIFFCLCTGRAQTMDYLLSWPNFNPFSRLSFSFFMIQFIVVIRRVFGVKETITMSDGLLIENSIIDFMVTFCLAYIFYSLIEAPFTNLMAIWLKKGQKDDLLSPPNGTVHNVDKPVSGAKNMMMKDMGHVNHIELEDDFNQNHNFVETIKI